jgi:hypothetical protein
MRSFSLGSTLALASLLFSVGTPAQTGDKPEAVSGQGQTPASGLSGIWTTRAPRGVGWYNYSLAGPDVPMTPWAIEQFKASKPSFGPNNFEDSNDPAYACLPPGPLRVYAFVGAEMQILQLPGRVLILFGRDVRQVYTDGRDHPRNLQTSWMGHSIGHWEGDTLVVDTIGTRKRLYTGELSGFFFPMSDQLHFIERIRMVNHNEMQIDYTVEDPVALTKPIHATITHTRVTDFNRMIEETDCEQNDRDPIVNGRFTTVTH